MVEATILARKRRSIPRRVASCIVCGVRGQCLRASHLWGVRKNETRLRQVVNEIRYNRFLAPTPELEAGRRAHLSLERGREVVKDLRTIFSMINSRQAPFYMTATFCSPTFGGIRCQPDAVRVEANGTDLRLTIIEDKTSNQPRYYTQLYAGAVIMTDRSCLVAPAFEEEQLGLGGSLDQERTPFYRQLDGFERFVVDAALNPYGSADDPKDQPLPPIHFSADFHMLPGMEPKYYIVTQSKGAILRALQHPQHLGEEDLAQTRFTRRGSELKLFRPKSSH